MAGDTRARILDATSTLFATRGMSVGLKEVVEQAGAPFGSLYHHFPGGKEELAECVIDAAGAFYRDIAVATIDLSLDLPANLRNFFAAAAEHLAKSDYTGGCPIATVALEVANTNDRLRDACRRVFDSWVSDLEPLFTSSGLDEATSEMLAEHTLNSLEGAFILAKLRRDPGPLLSTGEAVAFLADALLTAAPGDT